MKIGTAARRPQARSWARGIAITTLVAALCACGSSSNGGGGGGATAGDPPEILALGVTDTRTAPARISFLLQDDRAREIAVSFFFRVGTDTFAITDGGAPLVRELQGAENALLHEIDWDFAAEPALGESLNEDVLVFAVADGGEDGPILGSNAVRVDLGNDPPLFLDEDGDGFADGDVPAGEVSGPVDVAVFVADSSGDPVSIAPFFAVVEGVDVEGGELPDDSDFAPATPVEALPAVVTTPGGVEIAFRWDVEADLPGGDTEVVLRFRADDGIAQGTSPITRRIFVDNNAAPAVQIGAGDWLANPDERGGIAIPFAASDDESDAVEVVLQWRRGGEAFPELPPTPKELREALDDPAQSAALRIATRRPALARGRLEVLDETHARLPELGGPAAHAAVRGLTGRVLSVLRPAGAMADPSARWSANPLDAPVSVLPAPGGDPLDVLVLERPEQGAWRLQRLALATGEATEIAGDAGGEPTAMAPGPDGTVLVATVAGTAWSVASVSVADGAVEPFVPVAQDPRSGPVRGLVHAGGAVALATVADTLLRIDFSDPSATETIVVAEDLAEPFGLARDPGADRVLVAERGAHRLVAIALGSGAVTPLGPADELQRPGSIALLPGGGLAVVCDADDSDGVQELRSASLGGGAGSASTLAAGGLPGELGQLSVASDGSWLVAVPAGDGLRVRGGIDQRRQVVAHADGSDEVEVEPAFDLPLPDGARWSVPVRDRLPTATPDGAGVVFAWDSRDVPAGGEVFLRAVVFDEDFGTEDETDTARTVRPAHATATRSEGSDVAPLGDGLAVADVDGDGRLDLIGAARSTGGGDADAVRVLYQDGTGSFADETTVPDRDEQPPDHVRAADLTGDGLIDLAYASDVAESIIVLPQEPGGAFGTAVAVDEQALTLPTLSIGDFDGDGRDDLIATSEGAQPFDIVVFFQPPNGFGSDDDVEDRVIDLVGRAAARGTVPADVDADGLLDLGVPSGDDGVPASILFQDEGTEDLDEVELDLGEVLDPEDEAALDTLAFADFDGDGDLDAAAGSAALDLVLIFEQTAPRVFEDVADALEISLPGLQPDNLSAADLDGDGRLDLIVGRVGAGPVVVFQGDAGLAPASATELDAGGATSASLALGDLDGDGGIDLVVEDGQSFVVLENRGPRGFGAPRHRLELAATPDPTVLVLADLDRDGDLDAAAGRQQLALFEQTAPGVFAPAVLVGPFAADAEHVAAADLDGDGAVDLAVATAAGVELWRQEPGASFAPDGEVGDPALDEPFRVVAGDVDGDGRTDLVVADRGTAAVTVHRQDAGGGFDAASDTLAMPSGVLEDAALADVDGDGDLEIVAAGGGPGEIAIFGPDAGGAFALEGDVIAVPDPTAALAVGDLDGDGDADLVTGGGTAHLALFLQEEDGSFALPSFVPTADGAGVARLSAADVDGDGRVDLVADSGAATSILYQDAAGGFSRAETLAHALGDAPALHAVADVDGDGETDLATANVGSDDLTLFQR